MEKVIMYKVAIIIPIFNAGEYLENTLNSIINQTIGFENIELILVDDYSTDNSRDIIQEYLNEYSNIKGVFLKNNSGGASTPRNKGIECSTADYIMFMDSDDEILNDYCEVLYNTIVKHDCDIVHCNNASKLNGKIYIPKSIDDINYNEKIFDGDEKLAIIQVAWANIYKAALIKNNNITFPNTGYDDAVFSINCLVKTSKPVIELYNYPGYIYLIENDSSITHSANIKLLKRFIEGYKLCNDLMEDSSVEFKKDLNVSFINMALFILFKLDDIGSGIKIIYDYETSLDFKINSNSKLLNHINQKIMNGKFKQAILMTKIIKLFYNNKLIKNTVFIKYGNLKESEINLYGNK